MTRLAAKLPEHTHARLAAIYREHFAFVHRSLRRLGTPEHALEDASQDVFIVAARRLEDFEERSSIKTWLFGIAMRVVRTHRRSTWRHRRKVDALSTEAPLLGPSSERPHARRDTQLTLLQLLAELPEDRRSIYVLVELEGMSAAEVARGFELNVNTVYTRLRSARKDLRAAAERLQAANATGREEHR